MSVCAAAFKVDLDALRNAIRCLEKETIHCDIADLKELNESGYLPAGLAAYLIAIRVAGLQ